MINIISESFRNTTIRGPHKVVHNLVKGLERMGYPYVINKDLNCCKRLWIHDDVAALYALKQIRKDAGIIVGPNLFVNPENIPRSINLLRTVYVQPSEIVKNVWRARGYTASPMEVWPVGIDTEEYKTSDGHKDVILVYFKNRKQEDLHHVTDLLSRKGMPYEIMRYGSYNEAEYKNALQKARFMVWVGGYESQGIALQEALSCGVPVLVIDKAVSDTRFDKESTAAPYFDARCGIVVKGIESFGESLDRMIVKEKTFSPRQFVLDNLELVSQTRVFLELYEKHFGYSVEDGFLESVFPCKDYHRNILRKIEAKLYATFTHHKGN